MLLGYVGKRYTILTLKLKTLSSKLIFQAMMFNFGYIFIIYCFTLCYFAKQSQTVKVSPTNFFRDSRKVINVGIVLKKSVVSNLIAREFKSMFNDHSNDNYEFLKHYKLNVVTTILAHKMYPMELVNALCDVLIKQKVVAILYWDNDEMYGRPTALVQYFMHLISYTGIPIIAWNADNSGILANRVKSFHPTSA